MELYQTHDNFIIQDGDRSLWCNRLDGSLLPRRAEDMREAWSPVCRGAIYGLVGKLQFFPGSEWKLIVISKRTFLGLFPGDHQVYRIDRIAVLPLAVGEVPDVELDVCTEHGTGGKLRKFLQSGDGQQKSLQQTWNTIKFAATNIKGNIKTANTQRDFKDKERDKLERRLLEELLKMFNESDSFYYSPTGDITNTLQRQFSDDYDNNCNIWKRVDERFVWNKVMLQELFESEDPSALHWAVPVIQGYCKISHCENTFEVDEGEEITDIQRMPLPAEQFELILMSRRSVRRAGTRYKRRGVDEEGDVANYVETEQIVSSSMHNVAFVQLRGSVPVFWSQPGLKYRPPPRLDRDEEETLEAFKKHFEKELSMYGKQVIVNLVDRGGREKIISDVFMHNILELNHHLLTYITFDFHEYCRGMKFENVSVLVESIADVIKDMRYTWTDDKGSICDQRSVFRVNCMDCLDRTNVVQAAIARQVMETQLKKLGKLLPDQILPASIRTTFQDMWANNGDAISRQYAGTAAMKGDFTRTGERKITGVMKDGYNSASRYYLNRFKAAYRQTVIDLMLGKTPTEDLAALIATMRNGAGDEDQWTMEREECVAQLVLDCQVLLVPDSDDYLGGWALVDPFCTTDGDVPQDQDVVLLLTHEAYYVACYDDEAETITQYERVVLEDLEKIEIGYESTFFKSRYLFIRIHRKCNGQSGFFHTLRTIQYRTPEEARGVLLEIADAFAAARSSLYLGLRVSETRLERKKSKPPPDVIQISSKRRLSGWSSKLKSKEKGKESVEMGDDESPIDSRLREKHAALLRVAGFPRPHSDPCLSRQCGSELVNQVAASPALSDGCSESRSCEENDIREFKTENRKENVIHNEGSADTNNMENYNAINGSVNLIDLHKSLADDAGNASSDADFAMEDKSESTSGHEYSTECTRELCNLEQERSSPPLIEDSKETTNPENESCLLSSKYDLVMLDDIQQLKGDADDLPTMCEPANGLSLEDKLNAQFMGAPLDTIQINQPESSIDDDFDFTQSIEAVVETRLEEQKNVDLYKGDSKGSADVGRYQDSSVIGFDFEGSADVGRYQDSSGIGFDFEGSTDLGRFQDSSGTGFDFEGSADVGRDQDSSGFGFDFQKGNVAIKYDQATGQITREQLQCTEPSRETGSVQTQLAESRSSRLRLFSQARGRNIIPELRTKLQSISFPSRSRAQRQTQKRQNNKDEGTGNDSGNSSHTEQKNRRRQCHTRIIEL